MRILRSVGSSDTITARAGLNELNDILESPEKQAALRDYEEIYIENVCLQLKVSYSYSAFPFLFPLNGINSINFILISFDFAEFVTDSSIRCVGNLSAIAIEHLLLLYITYTWQECWRRTVEKVHGFDYRFDG